MTRPRREPSPAFQFYPQAWRSSRAVLQMSFAERGMYLEMLLEEWESGGAPASPEACSRALGGKKSEWKKSWPVLVKCFNLRKRDGLLVNRKLEKIRRERHRFRKAHAASGLLGAKARWKGHGGAIPSPSTKNGVATKKNGGAILKNGSVSVSISVPTEVQELSTARQKRAHAELAKPTLARKLVYSVLEAHPEAEYADLKDLAKEAFAKHAFVYDAEIVGRTLDAALTQLRKNGKRVHES